MASEIPRMMMDTEDYSNEMVRATLHLCLFHKRKHITLSAPVDNYNVFASLSNDYTNDIVYMIMNKPSGIKTLNYLMASFLRVSEDFD